jgi:mono/diheme cytochrome c family protein
MVQALLISLILFGIFGCGISLTPEHRKIADLPRSNEKVSSVSDFQSIRAQVFDPHCVKCHSQYSAYSAVRREAVAILSAISNDRMPKAAAPLSAELKAAIQDWITAGTPEYSDLPTENEPQEILVPTFESISKIIFVPKCVVCHNPNGQGKFLDLTSRAGIESARNKIYNTEKPPESLLIQVLRDLSEPMPPLWSNIPRLENSEIEVILAWIGNGLPD